MKEGQRKKQLESELYHCINTIFKHQSLNIIEGVLTSIASIKLTPDFSEARIYISFYPSATQEKLLQRIKNNSWEIKKELHKLIKNQFRRMPEIVFFLDDSLEYVYKMEEVFKKIPPPTSAS